MSRRLRDCRDEGIRHDVIYASKGRWRYPWLNVAEGDRVYVEPLDLSFFRPGRFAGGGH